MSAVSYVTEKANVNTLSYVFGRIMAPSFQKVNVMLNLVHLENVPAETNVVRLEKSGYLVASAHTEATAFALAADGELTDTYATATAAAIGVVSARSLHLKRFGGAKAALPRFLDEQAKAIAHYVDDDAIGLFASTSSTVTSTTVTTFDDLYLGQYNIFAGDCPDQNVPLCYVAGPKSFYNLKVNASKTGAAAFANDAMLGIFKDTGGKPLPNGYVGEICPGIQGWQTTGFGTSSADDCYGLFHPMWGFAAIVDDNIIVKQAEKIVEGVYDEVASFLFYDVLEYHAAACCLVKSDT